MSKKNNQKLYDEPKKEGFIKSFAKQTVALIAAGGIGVGAGMGTAAMFDMGKNAYDRHNATEIRKDHFWSKGVEVYCRNGQPVSKKGGK